MLEISAGDRLCGRYRVEARIADGAAASVFRAQDERTGQTVALKVLDPTKQADPVGELRFKRELEALRRVDHPNLARAHGLERHGELAILVLEYVDGETLERRLERGPLPVEAARAIAGQIARALSACHDAGIVHRDLKPANIVLHPSRGPVVLDFGVAWYSSAMNLTRTGAVVGSPRYMAPETFSSSLTDERTDVYALGAVLFEMLTGRPANTAESVGELARTHERGQAPSAAAVASHVPAQLDEIVMRALAPRPEHRFATAHELAHALQSGRLTQTARLRSNLPCEHCGVPRIIRLPFCPGCGEGVAWVLESGDWAVQVTRSEDPGAVLGWLMGQHKARIRQGARSVLRRLRFLPLTLVTGVSQMSAVRLADEAGDVGAHTVIVPRFALTGARLRASHATVVEALVAPLLHLGAVLGTAALFPSIGLAAVLAIPGYAVLGVVLAALWAKRPLMTRNASNETKAGPEPRIQAIRQRLARLTHDRSRHLAAMVIARATPAVLDELGEANGALRQQILDHLEDCLALVAGVDAQTTYLLDRPRSRLAVEIARAESQADAGDSAAALERGALYRERDELLEASLAHDAGVRSVLRMSQQIAQLAT